MKYLALVLVAASCITLFLSVILKVYASKIWMIGGVSIRGYLVASVILLLLAANAALIELLNKK